MATALTPAQQTALTTALAVARTAANQLTPSSPTDAWYDVLVRLHDALLQAQLPNATRIIVHKRVCSFTNDKQKLRYFDSLTQPADIASNLPGHNSTVSAVASEFHRNQWSILLTASALGPVQPAPAANNWHCAGVVKFGSDWTIYTSDSGVANPGTTIRKRLARGHKTVMALIDHATHTAFSRQGAVRLAEPVAGPTGQLDCVRFAVLRLIDAVERIMRSQEGPPPGVRLITVTP